MSLYSDLYVLVDVEKLLTGLPRLAEFENLDMDESVGPIAAEDNMDEVMDLGYVWFSLSEFGEQLVDRLDWLRSVAPVDERLDSNGSWTDGTRCLAFRLKKDDSFLHVTLTNWMQLALPECIRDRFLMARLSYDPAWGNYKAWLPITHSVMPLLLRFFEATHPLYGQMLFEIGAPSQYSVEEDQDAAVPWQQLWRKIIGSGFLCAELAEAVQHEFDILDPDCGLAHVIPVSDAGVWFTEPGDWQTGQDTTSSEFGCHSSACDRLAGALCTIPDSAVFPALTPG
jgi:hypothetical protein